MLTKQEIKRYAELIDAYVKPNIFACCTPACGALKYPSVNPSAQYAGNLWDWDSFWVLKTMIMAYERYKNDEGFDKEGVKAKIVEHAKGTAFDFFDYEEPDGFIPMMIAASGPFYHYYTDEHRKGNRHNQMKPFLAQIVLMTSEFADEYDWFDADKLLKYMEYYETEQRDPRSGLFYWVDDVMIGIDNNPTVFFRPNRSSADIFLNSFLAVEYNCVATLLRRAGDDRATLWEEKSRAFASLLNDLTYDGKDCLYYSHDVLQYEAKDRLVANGFLLHENMLPFWHSVPLKVRFWGCFLPMYAGICGEERAKAMDKAHFHDPDVMAEYGVRTVAKDEPYYNLEKTSNPSNWLGAVWMVSNYCVYKGLKNYGIETYREVAEKSLRLIGENLEKTGEMYESYSPDSGEPNLYPHFFNWDLLVLEMLEDFE